MKIWIHINGSQEGPYEYEALPLDRMDANTPVWYQGLPDWMKAGEAPLTAPLFAQDFIEVEEVNTSRHENGGNYTYGQSLKANAPKAQEEASEDEKCPPTYLGWSIAFTLLCCNPVGIGAIMTGATTKSKYNSRDYKGARKMSEITAWWFMITIVTSLILLPFSLLMA